MKSIIILGLLLITLNITFATKEVQKSKQKWIFPINFQWQVSDIVVQKLGTNAKKIEFEGEINSNERGMYFTKFQTSSKDAESFFKQTTYQTTVNYQGEGKVIDYELVQDCKFVMGDSKWHKGYNFEFKLRNFKQKADLQYDVKVAFKLLSYSIGGNNVPLLLKELTENCQKRQVSFQLMRKMKEKAKFKSQKEAIQTELEIKELQKQKETLNEEYKKKEVELEVIKGEAEIDESKKIDVKKKSDELKETGQKKALDEVKIADLQKKNDAEYQKAQEESKKKKLAEDEEKKKNPVEIKEEKIEEIPNEEKKEEKQTYRRVQEEDNKKEDGSIDQEDEKMNLSEEVKKIVVYYDVGYGNALYITGDVEELGKWKIATKLQIKDDNNWFYKSYNLAPGTQFKIVKYNWVDGNSINLDKEDKSLIIWENDNQGAKGNQVVSYDSNGKMHMTPSFDIKRTQRYLRQQRLRLNKQII